MIISASRRTDIPCFFSEWFMEKVKEGYVMTVNPMNRSQTKNISLKQDDVDCFVFWTKDAENIIKYLPVLDTMGYKYYFQFTITPYEKDIERYLKNKIEIEKTFCDLSKKIGKQKVIWRYDPIFINDYYDIKFHISQFERMCGLFCEYTERVIISFIDVYSKNKKHGFLPVSEFEMKIIAQSFSETAKKYNLSLNTCCEKMDFSLYGIKSASCIDKNLIENIFNLKLDKIKQDKNQRLRCGCCSSIDIGTYGTCKNGCLYCYGTSFNK